MNCARNTSIFVVAAAATICGCIGLQAGTLPANGVVIGIFSNPVFAGSIVNDPSLGASAVFNNTGTAVYSINNSTSTTLAGTPPMQASGSALVWGADNAVPPSEQFSVVTFFGAQVPANAAQPFQLGTVTYLNGTSTDNTQIFGATLSFYDNSVTAANFLGSDNLIITTTHNLGQSVFQDADYINICGNNSNICSKSLEAIEATEGGTGVTANLFGTITGDPMVTLTDIALAPGQSTTTNGFVGSDPPLGENVPEPTTRTMMCVGLVLVVGWAWRKRTRTHLAGR
jgi:hypothetical protein